MSRAIVSGVSGEAYKSLAGVTWPAMRRYADRFGAEFVGEELKQIPRPVSWAKLPAIAAALSRYDEVLWLDADVCVRLASRNIFEEFSGNHSVAACWLSDENGRGHFNAGVLLSRRPFLEAIVLAAMQDDCVYHNWWEQAAINRLASSGRIDIQRIGEEWNSWRGTRPEIVPQFRHACGFQTMADRVAWLSGRGEEMNDKCQEART